MCWNRVLTLHATKCTQIKGLFFPAYCFFYHSNLTYIPYIILSVSVRFSTYFKDRYEKLG